MVTALDFRSRRATCKRPNRRLLRGGLPFSFPKVALWDLVSVALASGDAPIWTVSATNHASPIFIGHPRSMQLGLSSGSPGRSSDHPFLPAVWYSLVKVREAREQRHADWASIYEPVPKGRFELPRDYSHYALNVARLPFRHFGLGGAVRPEPTVGLEPTTCCLRNSCSTN